eukprot:3390758-Pyramimonas_sp.AAC.2
MSTYFFAGDILRLTTAVFKMKGVVDVTAWLNPPKDNNILAYYVVDGRQFSKVMDALVSNGQLIDTPRGKQEVTDVTVILERPASRARGYEARMLLQHALSPPVLSSARLSRRRGPSHKKKEEFYPALYQAVRVGCCEVFPPHGSSSFWLGCQTQQSSQHDIEEEADTRERPLDLSVLGLELSGEHLLSEAALRL